MNKIKNKIVSILLKKYELSNILYRRKALVLMISSMVTLFIILITSITKYGNMTVSLQESIFQVAFSFTLLLIFALAYHRLMTHATNTFLFWVISYLLFVQEYYDVIFFIVLPMLYILFRVIALFGKQIIVLSMVSFVLLIRQLMIQHSFLQQGMIDYDMYIMYLFGGLLILFICIFVYVLITVAQKEIEKADRILSKSTMDFVLKNQNRRHSDDENDFNQISILLVAINDIDLINDQIGLDQTQKMLKEVISVIRDTIRVDDYILKWELDEFLLVLQNTPFSHSIIVAEKVRKSIEYHGFTTHKKRITVTICASQQNTDERIYDAVSRAQEGVRKAKKEKKNVVLVP